MPFLTDAAARFLEGPLERAAQSDVAARLTRAERGWCLQLDRERRGDQVLAREGQVLLVMAQDVFELLGDAVIDLDDTDQGPKLVITQG